MEDSDFEQEHLSVDSQSTPAPAVILFKPTGKIDVGKNLQITRRYPKLPRETRLAKEEDLSFKSNTLAKRGGQTKGQILLLNYCGDTIDPSPFTNFYIKIDA